MNRVLVVIGEALASLSVNAEVKTFRQVNAFVFSMSGGVARAARRARLRARRGDWRKRWLTPSIAREIFGISLVAARGERRCGESDVDNSHGARTRQPSNCWRLRCRTGRSHVRLSSVNRKSVSRRRVSVYPPVFGPRAPMTARSLGQSRDSADNTILLVLHLDLSGLILLNPPG